MWPLLAVALALVGVIIFALVDWIWMEMEKRRFERNMRRLAGEHWRKFGGRR